jgi:uncharacterized protein
VRRSARGVVGALAPAGLQVAIGSALFGLGMQLGGGCGSGTLYTVGGGSLRVVITLIAFCAGAFAGSLDMARYAGLPSLGTVSLAAKLGWTGALALQLGILAAVWVALKRWAGDAPQRRLWQPLSWRSLLAGPWPLVLSGALLALLNLATLVIAGHPWTVTWAFTLWGAKRPCCSAGTRRPAPSGPPAFPPRRSSAASFRTTSRSWISGSNRRPSSCGRRCRYLLMLLDPRRGLAEPRRHGGRVRRGLPGVKLGSCEDG